MMKEEISVNELMRDVVRRASEEYGANISYLFGDWAYIASQLTLWGKSFASSKLKYPIVCLYSPFTEERNGRKRRMKLDFIVLVNSRKEYTNEERERESFSCVLRPVYRLFLNEIMNDAHVARPYDGIMPHKYIENYRYGRLGVLGDDGKPFGDFIDAIEIRQMEIELKESNCHAKL